MINLIGKDTLLNQILSIEANRGQADKPLTHDYLQMLNAASFGKKVEASVTVGEMSSTTIDNCILYSRPDRQELSMTFNFHHLKVDYANRSKMD